MQFVTTVEHLSQAFWQYDIFCPVFISLGVMIANKSAYGSSPVENLQSACKGRNINFII